MASLLRGSVALLNGFSQIFLQAHPGCGLLILLAIALYDPELLVGALVGGLAGTLSAVALDYRKSDIDLGLYGYNAVLLGLLLVLLLGLSPLALGLLAVSSVAVNLLQVRLIAAMRKQGWLPGFTLPYILFGWFALSLVAALGLGTQNTLEAPLAMTGQGLLFAVASGVGQVVFVGDPLVGLVLFLAVWLVDRTAAAWMLCGSAVGTALVLAAGGSEQQLLAGLAGYNPALAALAVSQVHRSPLAPALAIIAAVLLKLVFDWLGLSPLTMPFILACWLLALGQRWQLTQMARA